MVIRRVVGEKGWAWLKRVVGPFVRSGDATDQWFRIVMNKETIKIIDALGPAGLQVLEISGNYWNGPGLFKTYIQGSIPRTTSATENEPDYPVVVWAIALK